MLFLKTLKSKTGRFTSIAKSWSFQSPTIPQTGTWPSSAFPPCFPTSKSRDGSKNSRLGKRNGNKARPSHGTRAFSKFLETLSIITPIEPFAVKFLSFLIKSLKAENSSFTLVSFPCWKMRAILITVNPIPTLRN